VKQEISTTLIFIISMSISVFANSCSRQDAFSDPQGNVYKITRIGDQEWMAENLLYDVGDGCYCYENDPALCDEMGRLYTWTAALKASDEIWGWHLPSREEWQELIGFCGDDSTGYFNIISDEIGFNPQWSGVRVSTGVFKARGLGGVNYWSSSAPDTNPTLAFSVAIMGNLQIISPHNYPKHNACSVRLVRDR
jgi:uncharacterized protein (TIGR02145 family)